MTYKPNFLQSPFASDSMVIVPRCQRLDVVPFQKPL